MSRSKRSRRFRTGHFSDQSQSYRSGLTLIEMLIAVAITLVMMAAVVTLFANLTDSVRNRRATIEMSGQLRHVRNMLQQDLLGATCPGLTWQRPESNQGYIEIVEGIYRDTFPSILTDGNPDSDGNPDVDGDGIPDPDELDHDVDSSGSWSVLPPEQIVSLVPRYGDGTLVQRDGLGMVVSTLNGLGDYDDILMLTVRNEHEPFVGRVPELSTSDNMPSRVRPTDAEAGAFDVWEQYSQTIESPLAEVVWFAIENPSEKERANGFFGEPGMRTIYRRAMLIAPWINPYRFVDSTGVHDTFQIDGTGPVFVAKPGLVRILPAGIGLDEALAALIAFQERYDLSVRLEFDPLLGPDPDPALGGRYKIVANTLAELTRRENRFGHHQYFLATMVRPYPFAIASVGSGYSSSSETVELVSDPELPPPVPPPSGSDLPTAHIDTTLGTVTSYTVPPASYDPTTGPVYPERPFAYVDDDTSTVIPATSNAMLNDEGQVVRVIHGPVPLWGPRRGEDVMLTDVLAFDLRVYDPGAPIYLEATTQSVMEPTDAGWMTAYQADMPSATDVIGDPPASTPFVGQGAYVDMGYTFHPLDGAAPLPMVSATTAWIAPWFADARPLHDVLRAGGSSPLPLTSHLAPGYAVYDTWSLSYENNGLDEDGILGADQGTNGLDEPDPRTNAPFDQLDAGDVAINGPDDVGERETAPPYDVPLRGIQVILRVYERDARQIRQVRVNQHFVTE